MADATERGGSLAAVYRNIRNKSNNNERINREEAINAAKKTSELKGKVRPCAESTKKNK